MLLPQDKPRHAPIHAASMHPPRASNPCAHPSCATATHHAAAMLPDARELQACQSCCSMLPLRTPGAQVMPIARQPGPAGQQLAPLPHPSPWRPRWGRPPSAMPPDRCNLAGRKAALPQSARSCAPFVCVSSEPEARRPGLLAIVSSLRTSSRVFLSLLRTFATYAALYGVCTYVLVEHTSPCPGTSKLSHSFPCVCVQGLAALPPRCPHTLLFSPLL